MLVKNITKFIPWSLLAVGLLWLPRTFIYPGILKKYLFIDTPMLTIVFILILLLWRLFVYLKPQELRLTKRLLLWYSIIMQSAGAFLAFLEFKNFPNYVFSHYHIFYQSLFYVGVLSFLIFFILLPNQLWKERWRRITFFTAIYLSFLFIIVSLWPFDYLYILGKEDSFLAYTQFVLLIIAVGMLIWGMIRVKSWKRIPFFFLSVFFFFFAGEEISWGQRIFNIPSSNYLLKNNVQGEITLHNMNFIGYSPIILSYIGIGVFFMLGSFFRSYFIRHHKHANLAALLPRWYTGFYFYPILLYNTYTSQFVHTIGNLAEPTELMMYLGFLLYSITLVYDLK